MCFSVLSVWPAGVCCHKFGVCVITVILLWFIKEYQGEEWIFCLCVCMRVYTYTCMLCPLMSHTNEKWKWCDTMSDFDCCLSLDVYRVLIKLQLRCESLTSYRLLCSATNLTCNTLNFQLCLHVLTTWVLSHLNLDLLIPKL